MDRIKMIKKAVEKLAKAKQQKREDAETERESKVDTLDFND